MRTTSAAERQSGRSRAETNHGKHAKTFLSEAEKQKTNEQKSPGQEQAFRCFSFPSTENQKLLMDKQVLFTAYLYRKFALVSGEEQGAGHGGLMPPPPTVVVTATVTENGVTVSVSVVE